MAVVYRIIRFEGTEEAIKNQLASSVANDMTFEIGKDLVMSVKDRTEDPNEQGFFDSCSNIRFHGVLTQNQFNQVREEQAKATLSTTKE